jgi:ankyrin repeat protein
VCVWQYPGEEETVWNACSFLQHLPGRDEVVLPPGGGVVRIYHVLVSANSRAETVEELEGRRKRVVVQVLDTLHADVCRAVDAAAATEEFQQRVAQDKSPRDKDNFIRSIKDESEARVAVYKALPDGAYGEIELLGEAVYKGLALQLLANAKIRLWLEDPSLNLVHMGWKDGPDYLGLKAAQGRRLARRRRLLLQDSIPEDGLGRMCGKATAALALEDCCERLLVTGRGSAALERKSPFSGETPLIAQVQLGEYDDVKRLLQARADANAATARGERALLIAAKEGREDLVELLAGFQAEVDGSDATGTTALIWASKGGHLAAVQALLKVKADTGWQDQRGYTSLHLASQSGHLAVVQTLLKHGANVATITKREHGGRTSLHEASHAGHLLVVQTLLKHDADVAARTEFGATSLHYASRTGQTAVVQTLVKHGADVVARTNDGDTPLEYATNSEVKRVLRELGAKYSLLYAAEKGMHEVVLDLIKEGAEVNEQNKHGSTSLHEACYAGHLGVVQTLLKHGANVATMTKRGYTSLHEASYAGHLRVVQTLLKHGANVATMNQDGKTSLHYACWQGHAAVAQTLLKHGADVAARDNNGETPVDYAEDCDKEVKKEEVKAVLLKHGADVAAGDTNGETPVEYAGDCKDEDKKE